VFERRALFIGDKWGLVVTTIFTDTAALIACRY
jgi:hypothetical protein